MTETPQDKVLHSALRLSVLAILGVAAVLFFHQLAPRLAETPPLATVSAAKPDLAAPRYFQSNPGTVRLEDLGAQIKRVAAARGISADQVRQLVNTRGRAEEGVDVRALNQELDARWPVK